MNHLRCSRSGIGFVAKMFIFQKACIISLCIHLCSSVLPQPVPLSDREVISRLRNCIVALVTQKLMLFDTSILYCYEASLPHQVPKPALFTLFHSVGRDWEG